MNTHTDINGNKITKRKKQTTRLIKVECLDCFTIWRCSRSAIDNARIHFKDANCWACGNVGNLFSEYHQKLI